MFYTFASFYSAAMEDAVVIGKHSVSQEAEELNNFLLLGLDVSQVTRSRWKLTEKSVWCSPRRFSVTGS